MNSRRKWLGCALLGLGGMTLGLSGCSSFFQEQAVRSQSPEASTSDVPATRLIGDVAVPFGLHPVRVENVSLVTGLAGTGSDPTPSPERSALEAEMRTRGVDLPNAVLASKNVSLVLVRGWLRPGIQKGDHFDVEVRVAARSETSSLAGGFLLDTQLREMAILDSQVHEGVVQATATGPVLVDPAAKSSKDKVTLCRGLVLGGGVALKTRQMGLVLKPGHQTVQNAAQSANSINKRFHIAIKGVQTGVAKARNDQFIELHVHPRYKENVERYVHVLRSIALHEAPAEQAERIARLKKDLLNPDLVGDVARQLEAIGHDGEDALLEGLKANNSEVRFYSAEALAYLDRREAAPVLGDAARESPAFRVFALTALAAMDDRAAFDELVKLLDQPSAETRYGAFRALCAMNENDPFVADEPAVKTFSYHVLDTQGPPMLHVARSHRPEIVLFGRDQRFRTPLVINAGGQIMITAAGENEISVSRYAVNQPDQKRVVSTRVDDVIRAIVDLGGTYPEVVRALEEARTSDALATRFEVDALPEAGRMYDRDHDELAIGKGKKDKDGQEKADEGRAHRMPRQTTTDLFSRSDAPPPTSSGDGKRAAAESCDASKTGDSQQKTAPANGFLDKMLNRDGG